MSSPPTAPPSPPVEAPRPPDGQSTPARLLAFGRNTWRGLTSMRTALVLLFLLAVAAIPGSVLPQRAVNAENVAGLQRMGRHAHLVHEVVEFFTQCAGTTEALFEALDDFGRTTDHRIVHLRVDDEEHIESRRQQAGGVRHQARAYPLGELGVEFPRVPEMRRCLPPSH